MIETVPVRTLDTATLFWCVWGWGREFRYVQVSCAMPLILGSLANPIYWHRHILQVPGKPWRQRYSGPWSCLLHREELYAVSKPLTSNISRQSSRRVRAGSTCNADSGEDEQLMEKSHLAKQWRVSAWTVRELAAVELEQGRKKAHPFLNLGGELSK